MNITRRLRPAPRTLLAATALALVGCGSPSAPTIEEPTVAPESPTEPAARAAARRECPDRSGDGGQAAFDEARALTSTDEYDEGFRLKRFALYRQAAEEGHLQAQHELGWLLFQELYMGDAPEPSQRATYVAALTDIFGAGLRGLEAARTQFPGLPQILDAQQLPDDLDGPLAELPAEWVEEALAAARDCYAPN